MISLIAHNILHLIWWFFSSPLCFYLRALISRALCATDQRIMFDLYHSWVSSNRIKIIGNKPVTYECDFLLFFFCAIQSVQLLNDSAKFQSGPWAFFPALLQIPRQPTDPNEILSLVSWIKDCSNHDIGFSFDEIQYNTIQYNTTRHPPHV